MNPWGPRVLSFTVPNTCTYGGAVIHIVMLFITKYFYVNSKSMRHKIILVKVTALTH